MLGRRAKLPVLAEISGPAEGVRAWSLRRQDFASLAGALPRLDGRRVVLVTGAGEVATVAGAAAPAAGEAAAVVAIALAAAALSAGRRTVLVECDLAHPRLAAQVGLAAAPGLHEYLRWEAEPQEVIQPVVLGGPAAAAATEPLVCVGGGRPATKAETLLGLQSFAHMVGKLRAAYELVILAGASAAEEPGPCAAAARQADAVVAALPAELATGRGGRAARAAINRLPAPALGAIAVGAQRSR
jgi:Mrp family chromosome partitioning ATPase